jgi:hypothetical protein
MRHEQFSVNDLTVNTINGLPVGGLGVGNVYYVVNTSSTDAFAALKTRLGGIKYDDGTYALCPHTASASAVTLDGFATASGFCVEDRNDYIIVFPSNSTYYIDAAIALNKKGMHLICPAGLGNEIGATNAARIQQITAATACIAVSDASVEIAGFYLKNINSTAAITVAATSYGLNIHHNTFPLIWTSGAQVGAIVCSGDGGAWGSIERNWCVSQAGGLCTCAAGVIVVEASATACRVKYNEITIGDTQTATIGISNAAVKGRTDYNLFSESGGSGVSDGGTITNCISIHESGSATGNRANVGTGQFASGGTASHSFNDNMDGVTEGTGGITAQLET